MPPESSLRGWINSPFHRFAITLPAAVALIVVALFYPLFREAEGHIRDEVQAAIALEINGLDEHFHERGVEGLRKTLQRRIDDPSDRDAVYLLTDGEGRPLLGNLRAWPREVSAVDQAWFHVHEADGSSLEGLVFVLPGGERLLVGRHSPLESFRHSMSVRLWSSAALIILAAAAIGWYFTQHLHRRLGTLAREAAVIQEGHLAQRLSLSGRDDELDVLAARFNRAFDEIERLVDASKHVSSAIAHDMRRPLISLRRAIDEARASANADPLLHGRLEGLGAQTDQLLRTFAALLSLARIEAGALGPRRQTVDLAALAADAIELYEPLAAAQGRELTGDLGVASVRGDPDLLFQVLQNLVENALRHASGRIALHLAAAGEGRVALGVRDEGAGVPESALPHLFDRFFRLDESRSAADGAGIGLALVKGIAEAHGGCVRARNARPGLLIELELPALAEGRLTEWESASYL